MKIFLFVILPVIAACASLAPVRHPATEATLSELAAKRNFRIGSPIFYSSQAIQNPRYLETARREFNVFTVPAYFGTVEPAQGQFDFAMSDSTGDFATDNDLLRIHNLIWCEYNPSWLEKGNFTGEELKNILVHHVDTVVKHFYKKYPGKIMAWDVVNEPITWQGDSKCLWRKIGLESGLGENEYIRLALRTARAAAPDAKLYMNDYGAENAGSKLDKILKLVSEFQRTDVPLDGVGLESHFILESGNLFPQLPAPEKVTRALQKLEASKLETSLTEVDVSMKTTNVNPDMLGRQALAFRNLLHSCLSVKSCKAFLTWGVGDGDSWIRTITKDWGSPLLFDVDYKAKPAYEALSRELATAPGLTP